MKKNLIIIYVLIAFIFLSGFTSSDQLIIDSITKRIDKLETNYIDLNGLEVQNSMDIYSLKNMYGTVYFNANKVGTEFSRLDNDLGTFFIMLKSVTKNGNSYSLNFAVGNPQYATYSGCKFTLKYNVERANGSIINWRQSEKSISQELPNILLEPGSWNPVTINVPTLNLNDMAYIELKMSVDKVTLTDTTIFNPSGLVIDNTSNVIESKVNGNFEGTEHDKIYKLLNGQIWQQTSFEYHYHYAYSPNVIIYKSGSVYKMKIDGVDGTITVKQLK